ncbi:hypothetical protein FPT12_22955 [Pseudomonas sp. H3(2019)]|nr:hypothetical protein FPT12_22955 [Pseudomonas sp. H3(2019)]
MPTGPFASRLAPTFDLRCSQIMSSQHIPCGSEPAREEARRSTDHYLKPPESESGMPRRPGLNPPGSTVRRSSR